MRIAFNELDTELASASVQNFVTDFNQHTEALRSPASHERLVLLLNTWAQVFLYTGDVENLDLNSVLLNTLGVSFFNWYFDLLGPYIF